jgi:hypothetical protein
MSDVNGWVTRKGVDATGEDYLGQLALLSIGKNLSALSVRGQEERVAPEDRLFMVGEFQVHYVAGPKFMAIGSADAVWKNGVRLNRTRWEQLNETWKFGVLGLLGGLLLAIGRSALPALGRRRAEDPITWMP